MNVTGVPPLTLIAALAAAQTLLDVVKSHEQTPLVRASITFQLLAFGTHQHVIGHELKQLAHETGFLMQVFEAKAKLDDEEPMTSKRAGEALLAMGETACRAAIGGMLEAELFIEADGASPEFTAFVRAWARAHNGGDREQGEESLLRWQAMKRAAQEQES